MVHRETLSVYRRKTRPGLVCLLVLSAWSLGGCSSPGIPGLVPVTGIVTLEGQPLTGIAIQLRPDASQGNTTTHLPAGLVDAKGRFTINTNGHKGAPPGWYRAIVLMNEYEAGPGGGWKEKPAPYAARYSRTETTDLVLEVRPKAPPGSYDLALTK